FRLGQGVWVHSAFNSSYGAMYFGRPKIRSAKTNDITDISLVGDVFGVHAYNDAKAEVWIAPAGLQRGRIPNTLGVHYNVGTPGRSSEMDDLVNNQISPIVDFSDEGTVIWGEQTLQRAPSALQSLHIRRLLIYMRKALLKINRIYLFEPNDPITWRRVFNLINPWMEDLLKRRAFYEYLIQCDQDAKSINDAILNTPERIDRGEFVCRLFIKPTRTLKYFGIEAVITKSNANFKELLDIRL
ncbi:MAG: phage tail protein, partial [Deltaproteobacteria bacterium]|nr:phage tail protein [Deltaproteobacteria bacterium]